MSKTSRLRFRFSAVFVGVGLIAAVAFAGAAQGATRPSAPREEVTHYRGGTVTSVHGGTMADKAQAQTKARGSVNSGKVSANSTFYLPRWLHDYGMEPMSGNKSTVNGKTYVAKTGGWDLDINFTDSSSNTYWYGSTPFYANQIRPNMTWDVDGFNIQVNIPFGVGFSGTNDTVRWAPPSEYYTWHVGMVRNSAVHFSSWIKLYGPDLDVNASVLLYNTWYYVNG